MKYIRLLLLFSLTSFQVAGQSIFLLELNFVDDNSLTPYQDSTIHALVFYLDENSKDNVMRLYFKSKSGEKFIGEQRITAKKEMREGVEYLILKGDSSRNFSGGEFFKEDYYISCIRDEEDSLYYPYGTWMYKNNDIGSIRVKGDLTSISQTSKDKTLNIEDVTDSLLRDFGMDRKTDVNEPMTGSTLHVLLVTHSNDPGLGTAFGKNGDNMKRTFENIAMISGMKLVVKEVSGDDFDKDAVSKLVGGYAVGKNDVLVFYYSGHGFRLPGQSSRFPYLALRSNFTQAFEDHTIRLDEIYRALEAKGARLLLVVGECCNTAIKKSDVQEKHTLVVKPSRSYSLDPAKVKKLFRSSGKILVATCSPDERSAYRVEAGGLFFNNLRSNIYSYTSLLNDKQVSWRSVIEGSVVDTRREAISIINHSQEPIIEINVK